MDIIEKLIKDIGNIGAKLLFNKEEKSSEHVNIEQMTSTDLFKIMFNKAFHDGNYNKAEDILFNELKHNNSPEVYEVAFNFYNTLLSKSNKELLKSNFSREEVYQGLEDIKKYI